MRVYMLNSRILSAMECVVLASMSVLFSYSCTPHQLESKLSAEEIAYDKDVSQLVAASCLVGTTKLVQVGTRQVPCGLSDEDCFLSKSEPIYEQQPIVQLELPLTVAEWSDKHRQLEARLPPFGLERMHTALVNVLAIQTQVASKSPSTKLGVKAMAVPQDDALAQNARSACLLYRKFVKATQSRLPSYEATASLSVSFRPVGTPFSFSVNNKGNFSVTVTNSVDTPLGTLSFSASESIASTSSPKSLIIRASGRERRLFLDRPFKVFVPSEYGVTVINTTTDLILEVSERPV